MNIINRRKFIAELGKLLAFMYDEDKKSAISLYEKMFDASDDEQALISALMSPTRQAVLLARSYDAKERKYILSGTNQEEDEPDFVAAISEVAEEIFGSSFLDVLSGTGYAAASGRDSAARFSEKEIRKITVEPEPSPKPENEPDSIDLLTESWNNYQEKFSDSNTIDFDIPAEAEAFLAEAPSETQAAADVEEKQITYSSNVSQFYFDSDNSAESEPVLPTNLENLLNDQFVLAEPNTDMPAADFSQQPVIPEARRPYPQPQNPPEPATYYAPPETAVYREPTPVFVPTSPSPAKKMKANVGLLILFLIVAIPVTALLVVLLLIPAFAFLALAVLSVLFGVKALISAFGGFAVFADIMVVLGTGLVLIAVGVLFFWMFLWMIGSVITGLINGAINLGNKLCFREVDAV